MRLFVTVGNALVPFDRMLRMVDQAIASTGLNISGVCQHGTSTFLPRALDPRPSLSRTEFDAELALAEVVIAHAGVGTLWSAIRCGHRPLVVPRRVALGEHVNDHQLEIVEELSPKGQITWIRSEDDMAAALCDFARGERRRGPSLGEDVGRLAPVARVLEEIPKAEAPWAGKVALRVLSAFAPPLSRLRVK
jgi:UDP-N-acetylglucosamine transferase subunit ALG13